jgi:hypothetical protein
MEQQSSKRWLWILLGVFLLLFILGGLWWFFGRGGTLNKTIEDIFPFGAPTQDAASGSSGNKNNESPSDQGGGLGANTEIPMFRQLANVPVTGVYPLTRNGSEYIRYVEKETGHIHEVALENGTMEQLTDTTIPRTALSDWADNGNVVILRSLEKDPLSGNEVVKTNLGRLKPSLATSSGQVGNLAVEFLPDNIIALSVAGDGKDLFYLRKTANGTVGNIFNLGAKKTTTVFQSPLSEWLPQLLNDDTVIFTTKPSGNIVGYSYRYDPKTKMLERLIREKKGLTTLSTVSGSRILYSENISQNIALSVYSKAGFAGDEGVLLHERTIPLITLPEKCTWQRDGIRILCGSFAANQSGLIPDTWYQGTLSLSDTFWSANTDTGAVTFLADPKAEIKKEFDVINPIVSTNEDYFIFINKKDETLWAMHIPEKAATPEDATPPVDLSPSEQQDARGSLPVTGAAGGRLNK